MWGWGLLNHLPRVTCWWYPVLVLSLRESVCNSSALLLSKFWGTLLLSPLLGVAQMSPLAKRSHNICECS